MKFMMLMIPAVYRAGTKVDPGFVPDPEKVAEMGRFNDEMAKSVPMLAGAMGNEFEARTKAGGFPVRSRAYENGKLIDEETLVKVWREEAIPASMFEIPAGYKQKQLPMGPH